MQFKNIFKCGVGLKGVGKMCVFQRKTHISEMVRDRAKVNINH